MLFGWLYAYIAWLYQRMFKWVIRALTGRHELQRLCSGDQLDSKTTEKVENSLRNSKCGVLRRVIEEDGVNINGAVTGIAAMKGIDVNKHPNFASSLRRHLEQICGYRDLLAEVETVRKQAYQSTRQDHEEKLMKLWDLLMPDTPLEGRISKQWGTVGFQGDDPATDFRGMGMLGLLNLIYFAETYNQAARHVLSHSHHPQFGYSYAVVGINLTCATYHLLQDGALKSHLYHCVRGKPSLEDFHRIYCHVFFNFDKFWRAERPRDIMEFGRVRDKYEETLRRGIRRSTTDLSCDFTTDD